MADRGVVTLIESDPPRVHRSNRPLDPSAPAFLGDSSKSRHQGRPDTTTAVLLSDEEVIEPKPWPGQEGGERRVVGRYSCQLSIDFGLAFTGARALPLSVAWRY
jgi:hypothetical protein